MATVLPVLVVEHEDKDPIAIIHYTKHDEFLSKLLERKEIGSSFGMFTTLDIPSETIVCVSQPYAIFKKHDSIGSFQSMLAFTCMIYSYYDNIVPDWFGNIFPWEKTQIPEQDWADFFEFNIPRDLTTMYQRFKFTMIYFKIARNAFLHEDVFYIFNHMSMFNHSCLENCQVVFTKDIKNISVKTLRRIRKGEQLTISYTSNKEELGIILGEKCQCSNCLSK